MKKLLKVVLLFCMSLYLLSCSDENATVEKNINQKETTISFEKFKQATGLSDFKTIVTIPKKISGQNFRGLDDAILEHFIVNTDYIKQTIVNEKITYCFNILPRVIKTKNYYNLLVYNVGGTWEYSVMELVPTEESAIKLETGQGEEFEGGMNELYTTMARGNGGGTGCITILTENHHCTGTGEECSGGTCDLCSLCVDYDSYRICDDGQPYLSAVLIQGGGSQAGGGGGGTNNDDDDDDEPIIITHPVYVINPNISPEVAQSTKKGYLFWESLSDEQQDQFNDLSDADEVAISDYLYENDFSEESCEIVEEMLEAIDNGIIVSISPFFKYPVGSNYTVLYPKFTEYVKNKIPLLKDNQFIIDKLVQYSELTEEEVIKDLEWGNGPTIQIVQIEGLCDTCTSETYGLFDPNEPNVLKIDIDFVQLLENSEPGPLGDSLAFLLGVTILHEYVHFGDNQDNEDQVGEEGLQFEQATYGESIWLDNAGNVLIRWEN